jgi:multidrug resistance efflux pump
MRMITLRRHRGVGDAATPGLLSLAGRLAVTAVGVAVAAVVGWQLWIYYMDSPWTRDGKVRADVVQVAADVSGLVAKVLVHDN